jgi:hypothetical protein
MKEITLKVPYGVGTEWKQPGDTIEVTDTTANAMVESDMATLAGAPLPAPVPEKKERVMRPAGRRRKTRKEQ